MLRTIAAVLAAGALGAGCGATRTEIDSGRAEAFVRHAFAAPLRSVKCPSGVEAKAGGTLTCQAVDQRGKRYEVTLHMADDKGRVKVGSGDVHPVR